MRLSRVSLTLCGKPAKVSDLITFFGQSRGGYAEERLSLMPGKGKVVATAAPWKLLSWTAMLAFLFGIVGFGEIAEDWLRVARNTFHKNHASGDIVLVTIDEKSLQEISRWPWPRRHHAELTDALSQAGAHKIFFDLVFHGPTTPADDKKFAESMRKSGRVYLAVRTRSGTDKGVIIDANPLPLLAAPATLGNISANYNYQNAVWRLPLAIRTNEALLPSFATLLAGRAPTSEKLFMLDYSIDPATVPTISASDVLAGRAPAGLLRGKDVIIAGTAEAVADQYFIPGTGKMGGAYIQIIGAETLKAGNPAYLGWLPAFVLTLAAVAVAMFRRRSIEQAAILVVALAALLTVPVFLEARLIFVDITAALFLVLVIGGVLVWRGMVVKGLVNPVSNLPNLNALRADRSGRDRALIAARILNYEEILATLPPDSERHLVEQIVSRINVGAANRTIYQGDGGIFAWFDESKQSFGNHLEALSALFRTPARVGKLSLDVSISFGVEVGSSRSLPSRLASALVAADEAAHDGLKWKYYDPESFADASWRLSMLSQLDDAIDKGEVWVAYQPKLDLATRRIVGAEALARWTHPEKGPIAATEFVAAAEQSNRIAKLTDFVLEKAVAAAAEMNRRGRPFDIAVNLSARLLADKGFTLRLSALLARHKLEAKHITLELTETATLAGSGEGIEMLARLREMGLRVAIDDYGTGLSTLDYLKRIPADEIKIDQSFVKGIIENRSDRLMVQSTIGLAHSLGRVVVAEGVEHREIIDILTELSCDVAQGFAIGRPMSLESLARRLASEQKRSAA
jgi:EAL domain-containing protein (putative c-di-GMP-specific phosphodiesterase class I)/CHASE2 domain-containing sensor protein